MAPNHDSEIGSPLPGILRDLPRWAYSSLGFTGGVLVGAHLGWLPALGFLGSMLCLGFAVRVTMAEETGPTDPVEASA